MKVKIFFISIISFFLFYIIVRQNYLIRTPKEERELLKTSIVFLEGNVLNVIDGESFKFETGETIKLYGILSPDLSQTCTLRIDSGDENSIDSVKEEIIPCGENSKKKLINLISNNNIFCIVRGMDAYNRFVGDCTFEKERKRKKIKISINKEMVLTGNAIAFQSMSTKYVDDENMAKLENRGIWATEFMSPMEYKRKLKK